MLAFLSLLALWLGGVPAVATGIKHVSVEDGSIVVRFDNRIADASAFLLAGPDRIAIDVAGVDGGARLSGPAGAVGGMRQAQHGNGVRLVFDLTHPAVVAEGVLADDGRELRLRLDAADSARFRRAAGAGRMRFASAGAGAVVASGGVNLSIPAASTRVALPAVRGADDSRPLVVIDAGHGGHDPGAIGPNGLREKDVTLAIAKAIRDELLRSGRVRVALTRDDDRFLVLQERFGIARRLHGDLLISIHADSAENPHATGATVYTLSEVASDREAARLAARENKADIIAGVNLAAHNADISSILIDLTQRETMNVSAGFARVLGREAKSLVPMKESFHRMASLMVLKAPDLPSVLFETGYISNEADADFLASSKGRERIAEGVRRAVEVHFARQQMAAR